jgi:putative MATE family efflux protein
MNRAAVAEPLQDESGRTPLTPTAGYGQLTRQLLLLSAPVLAEHVLHIGVGLTDTYLANHLVSVAGLEGDALAHAHAANAAATAAVGSVAYVMWFIGLLTSSVGTGATAIIARAIGARHRRLANKVCGQAVTMAVLTGVVFGGLAMIFAGKLAPLTGLDRAAWSYFDDYVGLLGMALPFTMLMFISGACLRGSGDTLTPAIAMIVVDVVNMFFSYGLTYGAFGLPRLGFNGIAWGTIIAYVAGGLLLLTVLLTGKGKLKLFAHRLRPDWHTMKRVLRIGLPSGAEGALQWVANFGVLFSVNALGNVASSAHANAIRIESLSYMSGFAIATATATMTGQALGMNDPRRARRGALLAVAFGGGFMALMGVVFIFFGGTLAGLMSNDPETIRLTALCLHTTGFIQFPFGVGMVLSGALRGAGDTVAVMIGNLASIILVRFVGVIVVGGVLGMGLGAIWVVLCADLMMRGIIMFARFSSGRWQHKTV